MFYPLKFLPVYKNYLWGGRNLTEFGRVLPAGNVAEAWEVSCHPDGLSIIANGFYKGISLLELIRRMGPGLIGGQIYRLGKIAFPLLLKLIDAKEKLSVQVHPDDQYACRRENGALGKHEAWYVIAAKPGAKIICDLNGGTDRESFVAAVKHHDIGDYLHYLSVSAGDVIDIPPGVIHSIGAGIVIAEIQQSSNLTYRLYDYERLDDRGDKRPLQISQAVEVIDFQPKKEHAKAIGIDLPINPGASKSFKLANKYFSLESYDVKGEIAEKADGRKFYIYLFLAGSASIDYPDGTVAAVAGESVFIPADMGDYVIRGCFRALKIYVPDLQQDVIFPLVAAGHTYGEIYDRVCS